MSKSGKIVKIVLMSILALLLIGILVSAIVFRDVRIGMFGINFSSFNDKDYTVMHEPVALDSAEIREISVDWVSGDIKVTRSADDKIRISETADSSIDDSDRLRYSVKNGKLSIRNRKAGFNIGFFFFQNKTLELALPDKLFTCVDIDATSANIDADDIRASSIDCNNVSGRTYLDGIEADDIDIETVSGEITCGGVFSEADIETVSGGVTLTDTVSPKKIDVDSVSGKTELTLPNDSEFTLDFDSVSGKCNMDFKSAMSGDHYIVGSGSAQYSVSSVSGGLIVQELTPQSTEPTVQ